ncbi:MAG TPA: hypothetical protein VEA15_02470 [Caulobacteraceae bacterium]|nr:hypothetical protein [Caulobacteraceae bacterium]
MRLTILIATAIALCASTARAQPLWTWTLYEDPASLALANEVPDTEQLAAVLECKPGSGAAKVSVFPKGDGVAPVAQEFRTMDPAFAEFVKTGKLSFKTDGGAGDIEMKAEHRPKLERFARLCGA